MPHLRADSLISDPEGLAFLRGVLQSDGEGEHPRPSSFKMQSDRATASHVKEVAPMDPSPRERASANGSRPANEALALEALA